jgi:Ni,Fe-hydrogenase III large subunit
MKDLFGMLDPTITIGNIIEILVIAIGGIAVLVRLNSTVAVLKTDVEGIKQELKKMADILTNQAVLETRVAGMEQDIRELRKQ